MGHLRSAPRHQSAEAVRPPAAGHLPGPPGARVDLRQVGGRQRPLGKPTLFSKCLLPPTYTREERVRVSVALPQAHSVDGVPGGISSLTACRA